jgi:hypothetical protein
MRSLIPAWPSAGELEQLAAGRFTYPPNRRLADHLLKHAMCWF